jgi:hypothetical protein
LLDALLCAAELDRGYQWDIDAGDAANPTTLFQDWRGFHKDASIPIAQHDLTARISGAHCMIKVDGDIEPIIRRLAFEADARLADLVVGVYTLAFQIVLIVDIICAFNRRCKHKSPQRHSTRSGSIGIFTPD